MYVSISFQDIICANWWGPYLAFTAFTDTVLGIVPVTAFWKLQLSTKTRVGLCFLMGCTLIAAICSIIKTTKLYQLDEVHDFTYGTVDLVIWAV
jgi:hypothetical protein